MATLIGIIGCGNMGSALIEGIQKQAALRKKYHLMGSETDPNKRRDIQSKYRISVTQENQKLAQESEVILLAVKPQEIREVLKGITGQVGETKLILSIAAGIPTRLIEETLGGSPKVVRIMPNTPALVSEGISAIAPGRFAQKSDVKIAKEILSSVSEVVELEEKYLDAVTALSGSGPAYFAYWIKALVEQGIDEGLDPKVALRLAEQTAKGTAVLLQKTKLSPEELITRVASKGGTTEAALKVFEQNQVGETIKRAVKAATERSRELSRM